MCLILQKDDSLSNTFAKWKGPATIVKVVSPYSYMVEYEGSTYHLHANKLRKYVLRLDDIRLEHPTEAEHDDVIAARSQCAFIYETDEDFGNIKTVETEAIQAPLPSQRIDAADVAHLEHDQRGEYLAILDKFACVFSEVPGLCTVVTHEINMSPDFQPRKLHPYRIPDQYKPEVKRQIEELLARGFIERSTSRQVSPLVCVLKPPDASGHRAVRICVDYGKCF